MGIDRSHAALGTVGRALHTLCPHSAAETWPGEMGISLCLSLDNVKTNVAVGELSVSI